MKQYDIIVAGGGFAGAAAAIAAGRQGKKVLLFDKSNCMGGAAANNLVTPFMKFSTEIDGVETRLSDGLFLEIQNRLDEMRLETGELRHYMPGGTQRAYFSEEHLKILLNRMALEAGVELLYNVTLCGVTVENDTLTAVTVATKAGTVELSAKCFIDATGDATLSVLSGAPYRLGRDGDSLCQPMTLCFRLSNVDLELVSKQWEEIERRYKEWQAQGKIKNPREDVLAFRTVQDNVLHFNTTRVVKLNPTDPFDVTKAELIAREQVYEMYLFLKKNFTAFEKAELLMTAGEIGVRESRMIVGQHVLTGRELVDCCRFEDAVCCGNYDIDIHNPEGSGTSHYFFPKGQYYQIPYRSLVPQKIKNLLVAGRCISVDHEAQASIRIMPIVCTIGEASGVGAAVAVEQGVTPGDADAKEIQKRLIAAGAFIR